MFLLFLFLFFFFSIFQEKRRKEIAEEKIRLLEIAKKRKQMETKQVEFSNKLKQAAASGDKEALSRLINDVTNVGIDPDDPVVVQAKEVRPKKKRERKEKKIF